MKKLYEGDLYSITLEWNLGGFRLWPPFSDEDLEMRQRITITDKNRLYFSREHWRAHVEKPDHYRYQTKLTEEEKKELFDSITEILVKDYDRIFNDLVLDGSLYTVIFKNTEGKTFKHETWLGEIPEEADKKKILKAKVKEVSGLKYIAVI